MTFLRKCMSVFAALRSGTDKLNGERAKITELERRFDEYERGKSESDAAYDTLMGVIRNLPVEATGRCADCLVPKLQRELAAAKELRHDRHGRRRGSRG